jgi:hypothetical protein
MLQYNSDKENSEAEDTERFGKGLLPVLCNLRYAVARVLMISGPSDVIAQLLMSQTSLVFISPWQTLPTF